jgi:hypothetical protein
MTFPEGGNEIDLQQLTNAFGYSVYFHILLNERVEYPLLGDEVRSPYWTRSDKQRPVYVREYASFHHCCTEEGSFTIPGPGGGLLHFLNFINIS